MIRLTKKITEEEYEKYNISKEFKYSISNDDKIKAFRKLGEYEDADEELGVSYTTLMDVKKNGFYIKGSPNKQQALEIDIMNECISYDIGFGDREIFYFKDFGKTWSINKEDLMK